MPIYEYKCDACKGRIEVMQRLSDAALSVCSTCGGALHKLISPSGLMFKGSGWYITDYTKKSGASDQKEGGEKKSPTSDASTESKSAESKESAKTSDKTPAETPAKPSPKPSTAPAAS